MKITKEDLANRFTYHPPTKGQPELYQDIRQMAYNMAVYIVDNVPESREQSTALTKLEEAVMWANAGVARNG